MKRFGMMIGLGLMLVALAPLANAAIVDGLMLSNGAGMTVTIDSTGTVTFGGTCTIATCTTVVSSGTPSQITWSGMLGTFTTNVSTGIAPPTLTSPGLLDLNTINVKSAESGSLTILYSAIGFTGVTGFQMQAGGTISNGTVTNTTYYNAGNTLFGQSTLIGTTGPMGPGAFSSTVNSGVVSGAGPYSLTEKLVLAFTGPGTDSGDFALNGVPEPTTISLLGGVLLFTTAAIRRKMRRA